MTTDNVGVLVAAVSGGIDSVVMLDVLAKEHRQLIVAHIDHGMRDDSAEDAALVEKLASEYGYIYESNQLNLGDASEEQARIARHAALRTIQQHHGALAIATAHHEDDVLETMAINIARGTGWRGICSLRETSEYVRPLLDWSKHTIVTYAIENRLQWREDSTNDDVKYLRNYFRHGALSRLDVSTRKALLEISRSQATLRQTIDTEVERLRSISSTSGGISRYHLIMIGQLEAFELLRSLVGSLEQRRMSDLWLFAKVAKPGARWSLNKDEFVIALQDSLIVSRG